MQCNESSADRLVRAIVGIVLLVVAAVVRRWFGMLLALVAGLLLLSSFTGSCHVYKVLGISTAPKPRTLV